MRFRRGAFGAPVSQGKASLLRRILSAVAAIVIATVGLVAMPTVASAAPNGAIVVDQVVIGGGSGPGGQLVVGDTISISGTWDASDADPHAGDEFTIGLPKELDIPVDVPFNLSGSNANGDIVD